MSISRTAFSVLGSSSAVPVGNLFTSMMCATMSAFWAGVTALGPLGGIEMRMRSNRSPTDNSFQLPMKSDPVSAGAKPSPARSLP